MNNRRDPESSVDTRFSLSSNFHGLKLDFPHFNGDDPTGWIYREEQYFSLHNTLISIKSPLHPFIWNMKHFNGSVGTSRLMPSQTRQIFPNSSCSDLVLVLLMTSQEHSPNFAKLALCESIRQNLRNSPITPRDCLLHSTLVVLSVVRRMQYALRLKCCAPAQ